MTVQSVGSAKCSHRFGHRTAGLPNWSHAASPCLRSRLALGVEATESHLKRIEQAEQLVFKAFDLSPNENMRVRMLAGNRAMIELDRYVAQESWRCTHVLPALPVRVWRRHLSYALLL